MSFCRIHTIFCFSLVIWPFLFAEAQDSTQSNISLTGFLEAYYSYDFSKPPDHEKADFLYNYKRHNELSINLALLGLSYVDSNKRASLGIMAGTYPQYNTASEPELLRFIYEASIGLKLFRNQDLWIDAGIMPSHIGFETAISKDCWTLTRSIQAENSPYYEAGIKLSSKTKNKKWLMAIMVLNGWQRITKVDGNNLPAFGTQLTYTLEDRLQFNSSTFVGSDKPDSTRQWRYFHNLYSIWKISRRWSMTGGFDIGAEQTKKGSSAMNIWYSPVLILRYQFKNWTFAGRAEYYSDKKGVIVSLINSNPIQMQGYSANVDRQISKGLCFRFEGRMFRNTSEYFGGLKNKNTQLTTSILFSY